MVILFCAASLTTGAGDFFSKSLKGVSLTSWVFLYRTNSGGTTKSSSWPEASDAMLILASFSVLEHGAAIIPEPDVRFLCSTSVEEDGLTENNVVSETTSL